MDIDQYEASLKDKQDNQDNQDNVQDELDGLFDFNDDDNDFDIEDEQEEEDSEDQSDDESNEDQNEDQESEDKQEDEQKEDKPKQSDEENARFAEMRRQQQLDKQLQERMQQTPEYRVAQMLAQRYGVTTEQMLQQLEDEQLKQEAKTQNVPVEFLRQRQEDLKRVESVQAELNQLRFESWKSRVDREAEAAKQSLPLLTDDDIQQSIQFMLRTNPDVPLEEAIYAVHGRKIADSIREQAKQEALAELSGRTSNSPLPMKGGKSDPAVQLSADEKYVAKQMGISEKDYLKYKRK
jgi:hypothetical protein